METNTKYFTVKGYEYRVAWEIDDFTNFDEDFKEFQRVKDDMLDDEILAYWADRGYYIA